VEPTLPDEDLSTKNYEEETSDRHSKRDSKRNSKDVISTERRVERKNVVTREKIIRRSPVKEPNSAGNRGNEERQRRSVESPTFRKNEKEVEEREQDDLGERRLANWYSDYTMESPGDPDTSFNCSPCESRIRTTSVFACAEDSLAQTVRRHANARAGNCNVRRPSVCIHGL
jgi:hypothetical protein